MQPKALTVGELVAKLAEYPGDTPVLLSCEEDEVKQLNEMGPDFDAAGRPVLVLDGLHRVRLG